jgi:hypothetical protein
LVVDLALGLVGLGEVDEEAAFAEFAGGLDVVDVDLVGGAFA